MRWPWVVLAAAAACGDSDAKSGDAGVADAAASADAALVDAGTPDATGPDADLATSIRLTLRDDSSGAPIAGATVLQHDLAGAVIGREETNAAGRAVFPGTASMLTAIFDRFGEPVVQTITLVDAGDDVIIGQQPPAPPVGVSTVQPPGEYSGASYYEFSIGWCVRYSGASVDPFTTNVPDCAIAADGSFHALAVAYDGADEPIAYSLFQASAFTADATFPAWSTDFSTVDVTYSNAPAAVVETGYQFASKDVFFPTGPARVGTAVSLPRPAALTGGIQLGAWFQTATEFGLFSRSEMSVPASIDVDLDAALPPRFTSVDVDVATDPERPAVDWAVETGSLPDACRITVRFDDRSWVAITPGTAETSVVMPQIPADLAAYRPTSASAFGPVDVWCYTATFFDHYWQSIDPDYLPDDGTWDEAIRAVRVP